ncbi:hypothetical protein [Burkholderia cenocepacia]|uniref:hypothetical protein n=1 Tax=Burkholderia cenocepacia TaxID=95486 RepID=UPI001B97DB53|nr:hypothetical protein [Burkholderia cenocepacia]MBR8135112.1 hypothetical protein [Burkholderia cenocepacia]
MNISKMRRLALTMMSIGFINIGMSMIVRLPNKLSDLCPVDSTGNVVVDSVSAGTLSEFENTYFVQEPGANAVLLSRCVKGGCGPLDRGYVLGRVGEPVKAEFCNKHAAKLTISDQVVFQLTQQYLDKNAEVSRKAKRQMNTIAFFWIGFWLVLLAAMEIRARSQAA